jgi:hypothetical protein
MACRLLVSPGTLMRSRTVEADGELKRTMDEAAVVYSAGWRALTSRRPGPPLRAGRPWLARSRVVLTLRSAKWATFAGLQVAMHGYPAIVGQRSVVVNAPWFLVSALVARIGLGEAVVGIDWEEANRTRRSRRTPSSSLRH